MSTATEKQLRQQLADCRDANMRLRLDLAAWRQIAAALVANGVVDEEDLKALFRRVRRHEGRKAAAGSPLRRG